MESDPLESGESPPNFGLPGVTGDGYATVDHETYALSDFDAGVLVVVFTCTPCPRRSPTRTVSGRFRPATTTPTSSRTPTTPSRNTLAARSSTSNSFEHTNVRADLEVSTSRICATNTQSIGEEYGAQCMPYAFGFDDDRALVYEGELNAVLVGEMYPAETVAPMGCSTKWKEAV